MIWEVDEDCDQALTWPEFQAMYQRCRNDQTGAPPAHPCHGLVPSLFWGAYEGAKVFSCLGSQSEAPPTPAVDHRPGSPRPDASLNNILLG